METTYQFRTEWKLRNSSQWQCGNWDFVICRPWSALKLRYLFQLVLARTTFELRVSFVIREMRWNEKKLLIAPWQLVVSWFSVQYTQGSPLASPTLLDINYSGSMGLRCHSLNLHGESQDQTFQRQQIQGGLGIATINLFSLCGLWPPHSLPEGGINWSSMEQYLKAHYWVYAVWAIPTARCCTKTGDGMIAWWQCPVKALHVSFRQASCALICEMPPARGPQKPCHRGEADQVETSFTSVTWFPLCSQPAVFWNGNVGANSKCVIRCGECKHVKHSNNPETPGK